MKKIVFMVMAFISTLGIYSTVTAKEAKCIYPINNNENANYFTVKIKDNQISVNYNVQSYTEVKHNLIVQNFTNANNQLECLDKITYSSNVNGRTTTFTISSSSGNNTATLNASASSVNNDEDITTKPDVENDNSQSPEEDDEPENNNQMQTTDDMLWGNLEVVKCGNANIPAPIPPITRLIVTLLKILTPLVLIVMGMIDMVKAIAASDEKQIKEGQTKFVKRLIPAAAIFFVITIIQFLVGIFADNAEESKALSNCIDCMISDATSCTKVDKPNEEPNPSGGGTTKPAKPITSSSDITFSYQYTKKYNGVSYALYTPSTAKTETKVPLIIYLHGVGTRGVSQDEFERVDLKPFKNSGMQNFNAYVLIPHMDRQDTCDWGCAYVKKGVYEMIDEILATKNIDTNKIILMGHSMGGVGVYRIANGKTDMYSALVVMSASYYGVDDTKQFKSLPIKGYVGSKTGEFEPAYEHMTEDFVDAFGSSKLTYLDVGHGQVPLIAFKQDLNNDKKSDLIEWALKQSK